MKRAAPEDYEPDDEDSLFSWAERQRAPNEQNTIREAFEAFHAKYPEVYVMFERFALEGIASGMSMLGAGAVWERMRWETTVHAQRSDQEHYRLNNNYRAYYARLFMEKHPEYPEIFQTRKVRS